MFQKFSFIFSDSNWFYTCYDFLDASATVAFIKTNFHLVRISFFKPYLNAKIQTPKKN